MSFKAPAPKNSSNTYDAIPQLSPQQCYTPSSVPEHRPNASRFSDAHEAPTRHWTLRPSQCFGELINRNDLTQKFLRFQGPSSHKVPGQNGESLAQQISHSSCARHTYPESRSTLSNPSVEDKTLPPSYPYATVPATPPAQIPPPRLRSETSLEAQNMASFITIIIISLLLLKLHRPPSTTSSPQCKVRGTSPFLDYSHGC
jgi:hypothetical protein